MSANSKMLAEYLALASSIFNYSGMTLEDAFYLSNDKIMNLSMSLIFEIRELHDKGYTFEEILELINNVKFENDIKDDEKEYLKNDAIKNLKLIYKR